jgi:PAS domain S-box-containing protein
VNPAPVVLAVNVDRDRVAPLGELGLHVEIVDDPAVPFDGAPVLIVTKGRIAELRALWASVPLLVLVDDPRDALGCVREGADHVLLEHAAPSLLCAVGLAAMRGDITALRNSELRYRTMMTSCVDAILVADMETARFVDSNAAASAMFGYTADELRGMTGRMLAGPAGAEYVDRISQSLTATGKASAPLHPMSRKDGTLLWTDVSLTAFEYMGRQQFMVIIRDVTEQVAREQELERAHRELEESHRRALHAGRLAALGQLAASVAHEINNPLQFVLARLEDL